MIRAYGELALAMVMLAFVLGSIAYIVTGSTALTAVAATAPIAFTIGGLFAIGVWSGGG